MTAHREPESPRTERPASVPAERRRHDYEPGHELHAMHTDKLCRVCGQPARAWVHR